MTAENSMGKVDPGNSSAQAILAIVSQKNPHRDSADLPVDALLATAFALRPDSLAADVRGQLDGLLETHSYFRQQIEKIRHARSYHLKMETAE